MNFISKKRNRGDDSSVPLTITSSSHKNNLLFLLHSKICFICVEEIKKEDLKYRCYCCLKEFHSSCYLKRSFGEPFNKVCLYCQYYVEDKCTACTKRITPKEMLVRCEICSNKYHLKCLNTTICNLLNREYYSNCFYDEQKNCI